MGLFDETYTNKEKHFHYLHWKWNDSKDSSSILTILLLHFISGTSGAKTLPQIISGIRLKCEIITLLLSHGSAKTLGQDH